MCARVKAPVNDEPRWPLVPKLTRCAGIAEVGRALEERALERCYVDQKLLRRRLAGKKRYRHGSIDPRARARVRIILPRRAQRSKLNLKKK
jgi:hypothetical protein